jgi:vancomycin resistance protein YoaR
MEYTVYLINRKAVKIIERFSHSILVEYIKTGVQASVSPDCIRRKKVNHTPKEKPQKIININNQLNLNL